MSGFILWYHNFLNNPSLAFHQVENPI